VTDKLYIGAQELLEDSFRLGLKVYQSGFRPSFIVAIWRGGTPVGIAVQEILQTLGVVSDHIAIRTSLYTGIGKRAGKVRVHGLGYLVKRLNVDTPLLIVDDVFDSGFSAQAVVEQLHRRARRNAPGDIRIATPWYKPANNCTERVPDYRIHETDRWLIFPHELDGLSRDEVVANKPGLRALYDEFGI